MRRGRGDPKAAPAIDRFPCVAVLVSGREHYFNNDAEMLDCLGLDVHTPLVVRCSSELSPDEFAAFVGNRAGALPSWVPKRPLIGTIIREMGPTVAAEMFATSTGQFDFWNVLINTICERESRINALLDVEVIRQLYRRLGRLTRIADTPHGPISITQMTQAFTDITGTPPTDASAIVLQRLPGLGRIRAESLDRQFVDGYILDGLKAEDVFSLCAAEEQKAYDEPWRQPLGEFGAQYLSAQISAHSVSARYVSLVKRGRIKNSVLLADIVSALALLDGDKPCDFGGATLENGAFFSLNLGDGRIANMSLSGCHIENLDITDATDLGVTIVDSIVERLMGVAGRENLPDWISKTEVGDFQSFQTLAAIRSANLSLSQTFLLSSLRKLFLQPGAARQARSVYKGYGTLVEKRICDKVIRLLVREEFCQSHQGSFGELLVPDRSKTARVKQILSQITLSKDALWLEASRLVA